MRIQGRLALLTGFLIALISTALQAQSDYRNLESGRPVRISDAIPTERHAFDIDLTTFRLERLSLGRYRLQFEPRVAFGILPRTEVSLRIPSFYREPSISPRGGIAGVGIGGEYQLALEKLTIPGLAVAAEAFIPAGPNAIATSYSLKGLLTRSFPAMRIHLNGGYGMFPLRKSPATGGVLAPPVIDGPCSLGVPTDGLPTRGFCGAAVNSLSSAASGSASAAAAAQGDIVYRDKWTAGVAIDKSFALRSVLLAGDLFMERYDGIGRPVDWSAEIGARHQLTQRTVIDGAVGRRFTGIAVSWFATLGTTFTAPLGL